MTPFFTLMTVIALLSVIAVPLGLWADGKEDRRKRK